MKISFALLASLSITVLSCHTNAGSEQQYKEKTFPKPGTVVAADEMPVKDPLNHFTFGIKVIADTAVKQGVYDIHANYEFFTRDDQFIMPKGGEDFRPAIRRDTAPYTYIIGFKVPGDTTFYDYFQVSASKTGMSMKYVKGYTFN